jgi:L-iditol 2-dehydrogenase
MATATVGAGNADIYNPRKTLDHPEFRILQKGEQPKPGANIAAFYNPQHEIHLVEKPRPKPGPGQVLLHVRATGICGCAFQILLDLILDTGVLMSL